MMVVDGAECEAASKSSVHLLLVMMVVDGAVCEAASKSSVH